MAYDLLGRRTLIDNPDTGPTQMVYDKAGNLIRKLPARLKAEQAIRYTYDYNRLVGIHYAQFPDNDVRYAYGDDTPDHRAHNQVGRILAVQHQSGTETRDYGKLGEVIREVKTLAVASNGNGNVPVYETQYQFDTFGRLLTLTLPTQETLLHTYDSGGNLARITGTVNGSAYDYLTSLTYDEFEQRVHLALGNGVTTDYTYYTYRADTRRLATLNTEAPGGDKLQNNRYGYDKVGNILSLTNDVTKPPRNEMGGRTEFAYTYDSLYRLIGATGNYQGAHETHDYTLSMAYDGIHNITRKTQVHTVTGTSGKARTERATTYDWAYAYAAPGQAQPHAPLHIGTPDANGTPVGRRFTYDESGNQTGWSSDVNGTRRAIVWDDENRIQQIQDPQHTERYAYDDQGQRSLRFSKYGEVAYVNQFFTVRNGAITSTHVYAGNSRLATKVHSGTPVSGTYGGGTQTVTFSSTSTTSTLSSGGSAATGNADTSTGTSTPSIDAPGNSPGPQGNGQGSNNAHSQGQQNSSQSGNNAGGNGNGNGNGGNGNNISPTSQNQGQGVAVTQGNPGQGRDNRSDTANQHAQDIYHNPTLTGTFPGAGNGGTPPGQGGGNPGSGNGGGNSGGGNGNGGGTTTSSGQEFLYFYHPDHLGSSTYVTDKDAKRYEHIEYFPFGETWVEEASNTWRTPYLFTSKEMDPQTQLYYFGARYYDPRTSVWQSADPALGNYLSRKSGINVYFSTSLAMYCYTAQNPIHFIDPDGDELVLYFGASDIFVGKNSYPMWDEKVVGNVHNVVKRAREAGIPLKISSGYRTYEFQKSLRDAYNERVQKAEDAANQALEEWKSSGMEGDRPDIEKIKKDIIKYPAALNQALAVMKAGLL